MRLDVMLALPMVVAALFAAPALPAQGTPPAAVSAARRLVDGALGPAALRRARCASPDFANCRGGVQVVRGYSLAAESRSGDTVRFVVRFDVAGVVASSEASLMFLPTHAEAAEEDSGEVVVVRSGGRWAARAVRQPDEPVRTRAAVARRYFDFEPDERRLLDSAVAAAVRR